MKKCGFTLIELLGVIVVLGLLALITTPIIINTIENSKKNSVIRSAEQIIKSATLSYTTDDNFNTEKKDILTLNFKGDKPDEGYIQFDENEKVRFYMVQNGYCVAKTFYTELEVFKMEDGFICDWHTSSKTIRPETTDSILTLNDLEQINLLDYKIYGNSYQETRRGLNLFNFDNPNNDILFSGIGGTVKRIANGYQATCTNSNPSYGIAILVPMNLLKEGETYSITANMINVVKVFVGEANAINDTATFGKYVKNKVDDIKFTVNNVQKEYLSIYFYAENYDIGDIIRVTNIQLAQEGTDEVMPSPKNPSKIQTLGTLVTNVNDDNYGKYKIDIRNMGNNLFVKDEYLKFDNYYKTGTYYSRDIRLKPNTTYEVSVKRENGYDGKGRGVYLISDIPSINSTTWIAIAHSSYQDILQTNFQFTTDASGLLYIGYLDGMTEGDFDYIWANTDVKIEEGEVATEFKEETNSIYLDEPLRCVGDICDYIDYDNKQVVRKTGKYTLTGNEISWTGDRNYSVFYFNSTEVLPNLSKTPSTLISNQYVYSGSKYTSTIPEFTVANNAYQYATSNYKILFQNSNYNYSTLSGFKKYLQNLYEGNNPVNIYYVLEDPEIQMIDLPDIALYDGMNNIVVSGGGINASKITAVGLKK